MTPLEFAARYQNLDVYIVSADAPADPIDKGPVPTSIPPGTWKRASVASYRLGEAPGGYRSDFWSAVKKHVDEIGKEAIIVQVKTIRGQVEPKIFLTYKDLALTATAPFWGKGSPEEVQVMLQLRYRFQKSKFGLEDFTKAAFIGLDCNGFVGNYIQRVIQGQHWFRRQSTDPGPSTKIGALMKLGHPVKTLDELKPGQDIYLLAQATDDGTVLDYAKNEGAGGVEHGHIVITEPGTLCVAGQEVRVRAVESTGGPGLTDSDYRISKPNAKAVFQVFRGSKNHTLPMKITRLDTAMSK